jgi:BolA protein
LNREERIKKLLEESLNPEFLRVKNNSNLHAGHAGDNGSGETHFAIEIKSSQLLKLGRLQAHRKINQLLKSELEQGLHALELKIL